MSYPTYPYRGTEEKVPHSGAYFSSAAPARQPGMEYLMDPLPIAEKPCCEKAAAKLKRKKPRSSQAATAALGVPWPMHLQKKGRISPFPTLMRSVTPAKHKGILRRSARGASSCLPTCGSGAMPNGLSKKQWNYSERSMCLSTTMASNCARKHP